MNVRTEEVNDVTSEQMKKVEVALVEVVERLSKKVETAAEVEALAAVALALVEVHKI